MLCVEVRKSLNLNEFFLFDSDSKNGSFIESENM